MNNIKVIKTLNNGITDTVYFEGSKVTISVTSPDGNLTVDKTGTIAYMDTAIIVLQLENGNVENILVNNIQNVVNA